jgi:hypothetical protein
MIALISAALVAAQPAPAANAHRQMAPMDQHKHEATKEKCCCEDMAKGEHDKHAMPDHPRDHRGQ